MISRSTLFALSFACCASLSLAVAAAAQRGHSVAEPAVLPMAVHELPRVVVVGKLVRPAPDQQPTN